MTRALVVWAAFTAVSGWVLDGPAIAAAGKLTISTGLWVGYGALYLARDKGYFHELGLEVELIQADDTLASSASLASGVTDGAAAEVDTMIPLRKTTCAKGVVALDDSSGADGLLTNSDSDDLAQLRGQTIAAPEPGYPNIFLSYILRKAELARSDVTILNMRPDDAAAAFIAGRVAYALTYEPNLTFVANAHKGRVLFNSGQAPGLIADLVYMRCDVIERQPRDVKALATALFKADDFIKSNPDEAYDIMRVNVGGFLGSIKDFATAAKGVTYYDHALNRTYLGTRGKPGTVMDTVNFVYDVWGTKTPRFAFDEIFDPSFID